MYGRFRFSELTPRRLIAALSRRVMDVPNIWAWKYTSLARENRERLLAYQNRHAGQRCFVLGNGPSLAKMDLSVLKDEITFGANRIYLLFQEMDFRPTYYVSVNELVLEQFHDDIRRLPMPKFLNWNQRHLFADVANALFVRMSLGLTDRFQGNALLPMSSGGTVTYVALQLAYFMGCKQVILIGVDHSFADAGVPNLVEERRAEVDANHFHPNYFPKGVKWQLPDLLRSERAYALAREAFERDGREILDATMGGKCPVFRKIPWESLVF